MEDRQHILGAGNIHVLILGWEIVMAVEVEGSHLLIFLDLVHVFTFVGEKEVSVWSQLIIFWFWDL